MVKRKEAIVDTDFMNYMVRAKTGQTQEYFFEKICQDMNVNPVIHEFLYNKEMMGNGLVEKLVKENKIRVMYYDEFLAKENEEYYARLFEDLYKFCNGVEIKYKRSDFRTYQEQGANLGEIHSIILGMFTGYTLFFSDDKGAKSLADKKINTNAYSLKVKNVMDVLEEIAQMEDKIFTKKDFVNLTKGDKRKERIKGIKDIWVGS